ncbi:hypothetical protein K2173_001121 [Erythroxylum novogranatense]|uniref:Alpha/beta hydrolase fold-3 domain-containing protein n=1 Tax=Erythroxylum novogranatense TaxID=1862640 RepID=A0AAV8TI59_9ROSI|nr:hypothetical protein K2173_001121 [Erythroxylum novogranatense]
MDSISDEVVHDFQGFFKAYKDGRMERYPSPANVSAGLDSKTGVQTKDILLSPETGVKARTFVPKFNTPHRKLPLLVHYHGGGFSIGSPFIASWTNFLTCMAYEANVIAISIDYRLAPEHLLPIAYNDSLAALQWIAKHSKGSGPEPLLNNHVDFQRVFLAGDSGRATIANYVAIQAEVNALPGVNIVGLLMVHPYFGDPQEENIIYKIMSPESLGSDKDPQLNPAVDPNLSKMWCKKVLVCVAENDGVQKDHLNVVGKSYYEKVKKSEWKGSVELVENENEGHCFHLSNPMHDMSLG